MAFEAVFIKTEDDCAPEWGTSSAVKKERDSDWEAVVKSESELMPDGDNDEAYFADFSSNIGEHILQEDGTPLPNLKTEPATFPEFINVKSEQGFPDEEIGAFYGEPSECEAVEVGPTDTYSGTKSTVLDRYSAHLNHLRHLKRYSLSHPKEKLFPCRECPATFKRSSGLHQHLLSHSNEKPFSCEQCSARFKRKQTLQKHLVIHSDEKPFCCGRCSARFKTSSGLKCHLLSHSQWKPFSCEQCSVLFKGRAQLKRHLVTIHSDVKPYSCEQCCVQFRRKRDLKSHSRAHSEKPFGRSSATGT